MFASRVVPNLRQRQAHAVARKGKRRKTRVFVWRAAARATSTRSIPTNNVGMLPSGINSYEK